MTPEQFDKLKFLHTGRRALTHTELGAVWEVAAQNGLNPGCRSCPDAVQLVINRVHLLLNQYRSELSNKTQTEPIISSGILPSASDVEKKKIPDNPVKNVTDQTEVLSIRTEQSETKPVKSSLTKPKKHNGRT